MPPKPNDFFAKIAQAQADLEKRRAAHRQQRISKGLSPQAGTGPAAPELLLHGIEPKDLPAPTADTPDFDDPLCGCIPVGHSRLGGLPDLPPGAPWPAHNGKRIPFVAQLNCATLPPAARKFLPKDGHLFAFALISNDKAHQPPPCSVFLHRGPASSLVRVAQRPPDTDLWPDWTGVRVYGSLPATTTPKGRDATKRSRAKGETLGWLLGEMCGAFGTPGEVADARFQDGDDWINLLAIESEGDMLWSDAGHLYFLIRRSALEKLDFSTVLAVACSS